MAVFTALARCADLKPDLAKLAARSAADVRALLERFAEIARPGEGCPKILLAIARLVDQPWIEGRLRVEIAGDDTFTTISLFSEQGAGIRERLLPITRFEVPFDEFSRAIELAPEIVLPLRVTDEDAKLILTPLLSTEDDAEVPTFELEEKSLGEGERITAPPPPNVPAEAAELLADAMNEPLPDTAPPPTPTVHNRPTVPRMAAVDPEKIRESEKQRVAARIDPRREPD